MEYKQIEYITTVEASEVMEKTPRYVTHLCNYGRIEGAVKDGKEWKIPRSSLDEIRLVKRGRKPSWDSGETDPKSILAEIRRGECETVEFKEDIPSDKDKYVKTAVAFANGRGGKLVFGVKDKTWEIIGFSSDEIFQKKDSIASSIYDSTEPHIVPYIDVVSVENKQIIVVTVNKCSSKPCCIRKEGPDNGTYIRVGGTTRQADYPLVREMQIEGLNRSYDSLQAPGTITEKEINKLCRRMYKHALELCLTEQRVKEQRKVTVNQLLSWKIIYESDGQFFPTNAWYLLNGDLKEYPFAKIQCAVFKGTDRSIFLTKKDIEGPIDQQIEDAMLFVMEHLDEGSRIDGLYRKDYYELPLDSIREMVSNAVCHRSYLASACVQVAIYDDRLEVSSPGGLCEDLTIEKILKGQSRVRNHAIAEAFRYMHINEHWGSGMPRILRESRQYGLKDPEIIDLGSVFRISLFRKDFEVDHYGVIDPRERRNVYAASVEASNETRNDNASDNGNDNRSDNEKRILEAIKQKNNATLDDISERTGLPRATAYRWINKLIASGKLVRVGATKNGYWQILK